MVQQILGAVIAVVVALAACAAYFWGTNWLLDRLLATSPGMPDEMLAKREARRSRIRPWLFIAPALLFLTVYLIYPVFETLRLSFFDKYGQKFVGFDNYTWALTDTGTINRAASANDRLSRHAIRQQLRISAPVQPSSAGVLSVAGILSFLR